jgi:SAM-dependent methyltransferase
MASNMDSASWDRRYQGSGLVWTARPNRFLVAETETLAPGRAIDLACGEGRNAIWLAEQGWQAVGVDFSEVGLQKARELASARGVDVEWVAADLLDYRPDPHAFDLVLVFYLQLATAERRPILHAAAEAVAASGTLLVVAHDTSNLQHGYGGPQDATRLYTADDVVTDIEGSGLPIERAERVERPVQTPDGERIALDALLRARRPE